MDNHESWPQPSGLTDDGESLFATARASAAKKDDDWWIRAEQQTADLITSIQPIRLSEERRKAITNFVELLIKGCLDGPVQVETFGSVPLKTYLPDGDIDVTVLSVHTEVEETWAQDVVKALKRAEEEVDAEFRVKEVQYIQAEVKVIKCLVENIVVDISFNRTGGLNTFFFLEEVDRYIGKKHLFKRSIILVKAWCYYESRILGAHHGLISTFALETLVLYILHVFHLSLRGPLEVLYTFLVYFSSFDWDQYCVSLWGPMPLKSLEARISSVAMSPRNDGGRSLLADEFLEWCIKEYSDQKPNKFLVKYLNILDPIRYTSGNNLGRSVNVGSFKRIRSAFGFGARTLGEVLECSQDQIDEKLKPFFSSTFQSLERYRSGGRPDTADTKQRKGQWSTQQRVYTSPGDTTYHRSGVDSGSQSMLRALPSPKYIPPHLQSQPYGYPAQMHLSVSSAMPVPASNLGGPPSAPSVNATHHSSSSEKTFPSWTNSYLSMPEPLLLPSALPATKSLMVSVAPSREGATSHNAGFSPRVEEQRKHWRSPIENQKQPLHGSSFISNASAGRSFPTRYTSPSENCPGPFSAPPQVLPEGGGPSPPFEIGERLSRVSVSEAPSQLGGADFSVEKARSRENRPHSSDVKATVGMRAKVTNGTDQLSKSQSSSDDCALEFVRSEDGPAAELRHHWASQSSLEDTSVGGRQGAPYFRPAPQSYQEMPATIPCYFKSSALLSGNLEPLVVIPGQSLLVSTHQAGATGTELNPPFTLERQVLPVSVGVPGGPLHTPVVENGSVSTGPSFRYRPVESASQLHVVLPQVYYSSTLQLPAYSPYFVMPTGTDGIIRGDLIGDLHSNAQSMDFGTIPGSQAHQDSISRTNPQVGRSVAERPEGAGAAISPRNKKETACEERSCEEDILLGDQKDAKKKLLQLFQHERLVFSNSTAAARYHGYLNPPISHPSYSSHGMQQQPRGFSTHDNEDTLRKSTVGTGTNYSTIHALNVD